MRTGTGRGELIRDTVAESWPGVAQIAAKGYPPDEVAGRADGALDCGPAGGARGRGVHGGLHDCGPDGATQGQRAARRGKPATAKASLTADTQVPAASAVSARR